MSKSANLIPSFKRATSLPQSSVPLTQHDSEDLAQFKTMFAAEIKAMMSDMLRETQSQIAELRREISLQAIQSRLTKQHESSLNSKIPVTFALLQRDLLEADFEGKMACHLDAVGGFLKELRYVPDL